MFLMDDFPDPDFPMSRTYVYSDECFCLDIEAMDMRKDADLFGVV